MQNPLCTIKIVSNVTTIFLALGAKSDYIWLEQLFGHGFFYHRLTMCQTVTYNCKMDKI